MDEHTNKNKKHFHSIMNVNQERKEKTFSTIRSITETSVHSTSTIILTNIYVTVTFCLHFCRL